MYSKQVEEVYRTMLCIFYDHLTLYVHYDQLMTRPLKCEVAEGVWCESIHIRHETRIRVILDIFPFNEMLHTVEWTALTTLEFYDVGLKEINLWREIERNVYHHC